MPGFPVPVSVPVLHSDRRPRAGEESALFTYAPANEYTEHWVAIDAVTATRILGELVDGFTQLGGLLTPLSSRRP